MRYGCLLLLRSFCVSSLLVLASPAFAQGSLKVLFPKGGETICPQHGSMTISWQATNLPADTLLNVDLVRNGQVTNHIFRNIPVAPASKAWGDMPFAGANAAGYKVRVATTNGAVTAESDAPFSLLHVKPVVKMVTPGGGERWKMWETHRVEWSYTGCPWGINTVAVMLLRSPWDPYNNVVGVIRIDAPFSLGHYDWTVGDLRGGLLLPPGADYKVQVDSIIFIPTYADAIVPTRPWLSAAPFTILSETGTLPGPAQAMPPAGLQGPAGSKTVPHLVATPASVKVLSPAGGEHWRLGEMHRITWTWTGPAAGRMASVQLYLQKRLLGPVAENVPVANGSVDWRIEGIRRGVPLEPGDGYSVEVVVPAAGTAGECRARSNATFSLAPPLKRP